MIRPEPFEARQTSLVSKPGFFIGGFFAMGCPCEALIETADPAIAERIVGLIRDEAWRIEKRWSRYLTGSLVQQINLSAGRPVAVDDETTRLIDFCAELHALSEGAFDITSGVLREVWQFDGSDRVPEQEAVDLVLERVGWPKVTWRDSKITLAQGMQIDFGGAGKEYAVDVCCAKLRAGTEISCLVNFGGDIAVTWPPRNRPGWSIGVESIAESGRARRFVELSRGGLATSGDTHRFVAKDGIRYTHILDARTGWPVVGAPHSVSVQAETCTQAGMLATLASLKGEAAEDFLAGEGVTSWVQR